MYEYDETISPSPLGKKTQPQKRTDHINVDIKPFEVDIQ